jgi:hypothetical protein
LEGAACTFLAEILQEGVVSSRQRIELGVELASPAVQFRLLGSLVASTGWVKGVKEPVCP